MRVQRAGWGAALLTMVLPLVAGAQAPTILLGGGGVVAGQVPDNLTNGGLNYNLLVGVSLPLPVLPLALRIDGQFDQQAAPVSVNRLQVYSATANAVYSMHVLFLQPYLIGGIGYYHILSRYLGRTRPRPRRLRYRRPPTASGSMVVSGYAWDWAAWASSANGATTTSSHRPAIAPTITRPTPRSRSG